MGGISSDELILIGKIRSCYGLKGALIVASFAQSVDSFSEAGIVVAKVSSGETRIYPIESARSHRSGVLLKLGGVETREKAEELKGAWLYFRKSDLKRGEDEFYWFELVGLEVFDRGGNFLGLITRILPTGGTDLFVLNSGKDEIFIPAAQEVIKEIDLKRKRIIVALPEGLIGHDAF